MSSIPFLQGIESDLKRKLTRDEIEAINLQVLQHAISFSSAGDHFKALDLLEQALLIARDMGYRTFEFDCLYAIGRSRRCLGDFAGAQQSLQTALHLAESDGNDQRIADALLELANNLFRIRMYADAIPLYQRVLTVPGVDAHATVLTHLNLGQIYRSNRDMAAAIQEFQRATMLSRLSEDWSGLDAARSQLAVLHEQRLGPIPEKVMELVRFHDAVIPEAFQRGDNGAALDVTTRLLDAFLRIGNLELVATALADIGIIHSRTGAFVEALKCYEQALDLFLAIEQLDGIAQCHQKIGSVYEEQGEYLRAAEEAVEALRAAFNGRRPATVALCLTTLGLSYRGLGHYHLALGCHQAALETAHGSGYEEGVAAGLNNLGQIWWHLGDHEQALNLYRQSLEINRQLALPAGEAISLNNIASVYHLQRDFPTALKFYLSALEIDRRLGRDREIAIRLGNLAVLVATGTEDLDSAGCYCDEALEIARRVGDQSTIARCLLTQGEIHSRRSDYSSARMSTQAALDYFQKIGEPYGAMRSLHNLGSNCYSKAEYLQALPFYEEAARMAQITGDDDAAADSLANQAYCWIHLGNLDRAETLLTNSIGLAERLRLLAGTGRRQRIGRFEALVNPYVALIERILWPQQKLALAIEYIERLKTRTLVELLADHDFASLPGVPRELSLKRQVLRTQLRELDFELEAASRRRADATVWAERAKVLNLLALAEEEIEVSRPGFREMVQVHPVHAEEIRAALQDENEIVIELFLGAVDTLAFGICKDEPIRAVVVDGCKTADVVRLADRWSSAYDEFLRSRDVAPWLKCIDEVLSTLHDTLFRAIQKILPENTKRIIFVPHQAFHLFPLHAMYALEDGRRSYLIERFDEVSYAPSATVFLRTLQCDRPAPEALVAVENPTEDLRFAEQEVEALEALFPRAIVLGPRRPISATKDNLVQWARDAHVVVCTGRLIGRLLELGLSCTFRRDDEYHGAVRPA